MGLLNWLEKRVWGDAINGLTLDYTDVVDVTCSSKIEEANVYRQLNTLLPEGANVCLEVISPPREVHDVFIRLAASDISVVRPGTIWPKPSFFHIPATSDTLNELARLAATYSPIEMGHHIYAYKENCMLLTWNDFPDPCCLWISPELPWDAICNFCNSLGCVPTRSGDTTTS